MSYQTLLYDSADAVATITLNRPDRLNTIVPPMPDELEAAVRRALDDENVKVIALRGAGRAFCAGFDFGGGFFCRRDSAAINTVMAALRTAFYAGFKRSDQPPPSEARIEASS